jgi:hypothetical protein
MNINLLIFLLLFAFAEPSSAQLSDADVADKNGIPLV